jgi:hypothetical protein
MTRLNRTLNILVVLIALGQVPDAAAQESAGNLGVELDSETLGVQAKAEELFQREHYRRAHVIYLNDLAPIGDKYAQYMLGFMSLSGFGVEQDHVLASAWYRLAAERGEPAEFVAIRDELLEQLDEVDRRRSDALYLRLRGEYSDIAIRMREARKIFEDLEQVTTGSRLGGSPLTAVTIVDPRAGSAVPGDVRIQRAQSRMQSHLDYVTSQLGIDSIEAEAVTRSTLADLDARVQDYLAQLETP